MADYYKLTDKTIAKCDTSIDFDTVKSLWRGFSLKLAEIDIENGDELKFSIGNPTFETLSEDDEYKVCIREEGIGINARDINSLMRGIITLMFNIDYVHNEDQTEFIIKCGTHKNNYNIKNRMIHLCIFPETDLDFIRKTIRVAGLCQYTHVVVEFWGTLKFDTISEMCYKDCGMDKETAKSLVEEIRNMGMEPVPMLNLLGHASQARGRFGKHVVLDQNPSLQYLYTPDGWCWDIESEYVKGILKKLRCELYEVFGDTEYFHIGCDEAYYITRDDDLRSKLPSYIKYITEEVVKEGRRPMVWLDMFLPKGKFKNCYGVCPEKEADAMLNSLAKETVGVDWQYNVEEAPIESLLYFKDKGYDIIGAPWFNNKNYFAHIETIKEYNLFGIMLTTWHTLNEKFFNIMWCSSGLGANEFSWSKSSAHTMMAGKLLRIVNFEEDVIPYEHAGSVINQISKDGGV